MEPSERAPKGRSALSGWAAAVLLVESAALMIALIMPVTPSKTGSTWSPAELLWADPSYGQEVAVYLVVVHVLIFVIGLGAWILWAFRAR